MVNKTTEKIKILICVQRQGVVNGLALKYLRACPQNVTLGLGQGSVLFCF